MHLPWKTQYGLLWLLFAEAHWLPKALAFLLEKLYSGALTIIAVVKPFQTRPASVSTKKEPGFCVECSAIATTEALFKVAGVIMLRRYCSKCLPGADYQVGKY